MNAEATEEKDTTRGVPLIRPCTRVYLILMGLSVITWGIGKSGLAGLELALLVLAFGLIKGWLVGDYFMGLGRLRGFWRWPILIWLLIPGGLISLAFYLSYPV
ncbi:MAG: cytochrome C oxidase subunit IV family protein [Gammaproteobacteria bacterium SHHR-1]